MEKLKKIGEDTAYVIFVFGSAAYVSFNIYEGKSYEACLKMRSDDIEYYYKDGEWVKIKE